MLPDIGASILSVSSCDADRAKWVLFTTSYEHEANVEADWVNDVTPTDAAVNAISVVVGSTEKFLQW